MNNVSINYRQRKAAGTVLLAKQGAAYVLVLRRFDPDTGHEIEPQQVAVSIEQLQQQEAGLLDQMAQIGELIVDLQNTTTSLFDLLARRTME